METSLREAVEAVAGESAGEVERVLVEGPPAEAILDQAGDAELIVIGQHGRGAVSSLVLGSVSHHVLQHARCPVLVVPAAARLRRSRTAATLRPMDLGLLEKTVLDGVSRLPRRARCGNGPRAAPRASVR